MWDSGSGAVGDRKRETTVASSWNFCHFSRDSSPELFGAYLYPAGSQVQAQLLYLPLRKNSLNAEFSQLKPETIYTPYKRSGAITLQFLRCQVLELSPRWEKTPKLPDNVKKRIKPPSSNGISS